VSPPTVPEFFCDRYYVSVYRYIQRSVRSADVAADLTQEVFLRIVRGLRTYEYRGSEAAWVFTVARHVLATHAASSSQATRLLASSQTAPSSEAPTQLFYASLTEALEALPPDAREILLLRDAHGLSYQEIADTLGLTLEAVRSRLARVRRRLTRTVVWSAARTGTARGRSD